MTVKFIDTATARLDVIADLDTPAVKDILGYTLETEIVNEADRKVKRRTSAFVNGINYVRIPNGVLVTDAVKYGKFLEFGTRRGISPRHIFRDGIRKGLPVAAGRIVKYIEGVFNG